ncbi:MULTISPECIES: hypothetical protein [unclassified Lysobacter]|uniref:CC0125/CC1285 family lipoprotein n=1 Tax=unclassified Lysobacter TaxID=2635362 RepID=UPI001C22C4BC|nr:hypothetical protein [Lysobacter sp. MMG2]MBU8976464.1 hypothetical protein [Lysobacter sp. MMG2]
MNRRPLAALALSFVLPLALTSCATGYHSATNPILGYSGGYWDTKGPGQLLKVGFAGNGFISPDKVGTYLLYRCAEVAQREGGTHFVLYANLPAAIADARSSDRTVASLGGKPSTYAYILVVPADARDALSVQDLLTRLGPEVKPAATRQADSKPGNGGSAPDKEVKS